jgi:hypothetical protein
MLIIIETSERDNQYRKHTPDAAQVESAQSISSESAPKVEETSIHLRWRRILGGRKGNKWRRKVMRKVIAMKFMFALA